MAKGTPVLIRVVLVPVPGCQMAKGTPVMRGRLGSHGSRRVGERFRAAVQGSNQRPRPVYADQGQVMRRGRAVTQKLHRRDRLGQSVERPAHGRHSHLIVEIPVETGRNQPLEPGEVLWLSVQRRYLGEHLSDTTGELQLIVRAKLGWDVAEE